jgi:nucleotide-binding universal stress UspA family protein
MVNKSTAKEVITAMKNLASRILVAYDGSELGRKALETAVRIAEQDSGVALHVLHVLEPLIVPAYNPGIVDLWERRQESAEILMAEVRELLQTLANPVTLHIENGQPGERIVHTAREQQCDLIIMGSRGLTGIKEIFLASVSHYVAQRSECPVLIVK